MKQKIVITGGLGYIGTELCKLYSGEARYKKIIVLDNRFVSERVKQLRDWGIDFHQVSILDKDNLEKQPNFIERLKESTKKQAKREIATLVNGRVNLLSRTINKLGIGLVGAKGITPPKNLYGPKQSALGNALTNVSDRFFYDIRNELTDFAGDSLSSFLNGSITSFKK